MKIRTRKRTIEGRVYTDYVVELGIVDGKRKRRTFADEAEATGFLESQQGHVKKQWDTVMSLPHSTMMRYAALEERLTKLGATMEQAVDYYAEHHKPVKEVLKLGVLLDRCVLDMELRKVASHSISTFSCACRSFVIPRREREVSSINREEIKQWIYGNGWEPKTQRGYLGALTSLFAWAVQEGYLPNSPLAPNVASGRRRSAITLPKLVKKEPAIFTTKQIEQLFTAALTAKELGVVDGKNGHGKREQSRVYRRLIGYLALATFAGIRPFELVRLEVSAIDLDAGHVPLDAKVTKTNDRRIVDLSPNCVAWLRLWIDEFPEYKKVAPPSWDRLMKGLREKAKLRPWPHDVLRHCFASYFHALHRDKAKLQAQMGHSESEDTLDRHYRAVRAPDGRPVSKEQASAFWNIGPPRWKVRKPT